MRLAPVAAAVGVAHAVSTWQIENEAVVAALLRTFGEATLELVAISDDLLPGLTRRAGLHTWRVRHRGQWHDTWQSVADRFPRKTPHFLRGTFAPSAEEAAALHLDRCVRLLPHDHDGGGFFVALLRKVRARLRLCWVS